MGRPPKRNLNYSTWDVDVLENDTSIDNLIDQQSGASAARRSLLPASTLTAACVRYAEMRPATSSITKYG